MKTCLKSTNPLKYSIRTFGSNLDPFDHHHKVANFTQVDHVIRVPGEYDVHGFPQFVVGHSQSRVLIQFDAFVLHDERGYVENVQKETQLGMKLGSGVLEKKNRN